MRGDLHFNFHNQAKLSAYETEVNEQIMEENVYSTFKNSFLTCVC